MRWGFPEYDHGRSRLQFESPTFGAPQSNMNYSAANLHCGPQDNAFDVRYNPRTPNINIFMGGGYRGPSTLDTILGSVLSVGRIALNFYAVSKFGAALGQTRFGGWFNNMIGSWGGGYDSGRYPAGSWVRQVGGAGFGGARTGGANPVVNTPADNATANPNGAKKADEVDALKKEVEDLKKKLAAKDKTEPKTEVKPNGQAGGASGAGGAGGAGGADPIVKAEDLTKALQAGKAKALASNQTKGGEVIQGDVTLVGDKNDKGYPSFFEVTDNTNVTSDKPKANVYHYVFKEVVGGKPVYKIDAGQSHIYHGEVDPTFSGKEYTIDEIGTAKPGEKTPISMHTTENNAVHNQKTKYNPDA